MKLSTFGKRACRAAVIICLSGYMKNPKWHRDEIILALDLYFQPDRGSIDKHNPKVQELSELLNRLPLYPDRPDAEKFRNPNGVGLKLSNFLAIDPLYEGVGMQSYSKLDASVFHEFASDPERLHAIASQIRQVAANPALKQAIYTIEEDEQTSKDLVTEGQVLYKLHKVRERSKKIVQRKKEQVMDMYGHLYCEACTFDFEKKYGKLGYGYIECHHKTPLSAFDVEKETSVADLALVCANCHRMLHRAISTLTIRGLQEIIQSHKR